VIVTKATRSTQPFLENFMRNRSTCTHGNPRKDDWNGVSRVLALALLATASTTSQASEWSTTNVQLLYGDGYELGDNSMAIMTLEHANGWKYGDNFFFLDVTNPTAKGTSYYAEFSPRLSLGKITGKEMKFGIVKDVLLAGTQEMGEDLRATLLGVGLALDLPKFAFADLNLYYRKSHRDWLAAQTDGGAQLTIDWLLPFNLGNQKLAFEGFADYAWGEKGGSAPKADNLVAGPRLLIDAGNWFGAPGAVQIGVEYQIWRNKFGVKGFDEEIPQVMIKWTM
jgi:nucleoside-specific outer membrane channel protein Tsx